MVSKSVTALAVVVVVIIVAIGAYAFWTYPRDVVNFPVSFTAGSDVTRQPFTVPMLDNQVQITITVQSGTAIWRASILSDNSTMWTHTTAQGGMTTYSSGWMTLQPGDYNFTFGTLGLGGVNAQVTVMVKGSVW
jgi:hypothetical protein